MRDLLTLLDFPEMANRRGPLFDFLAEAQDYTTILAPLKKLAPDHDWKPLETEIAEARRALGRSDRIMWYLRIWRLFVVERLRVLNTTGDAEGLEAFTQSVVNRFVDDYRARFDRSFALDRSISPPQILSYLAPILREKIPSIEAIQFGSQNPNTLIPELQGIAKDYEAEREERERDKNDPLRRIDHSKPPTITPDYARKTGEAGRAVDCEFCGIKANDPSTWGRCKEREISLLKFDDRGNLLSADASLYATRWVLLKDAQACRREAESMIHCGNAPQIKPGDQILSLRQPVTEDGARKEIAHLTFILHGDGMLGEMKAPMNNKPGRRWHPHIVALLKLPMVQGIRGGGYMARSNFATSDLPSDTLASLIREKPGVLENDAFLKMVREKKIEFTPQIAARMAKLDRYELQGLIQDDSIPWTRETLVGLISGQPPSNLLTFIIVRIPGLEGFGAGTLREMLRKHPEIVAVVGEKNLLPYIDEIGTAPFSPAALRDMSPAKAANLVRSEGDLRAIPENVRQTSEFVNTLVGGDPNASYRRVSKPHAIEWLSDAELRLLDPDVAADHVSTKEQWDRLPQVITGNPEVRLAVCESRYAAIGWFADELDMAELQKIVASEPRTFQFLPDNLKPELAEIAGEHMPAAYVASHIEDAHRTPTAWQKFYDNEADRGQIKRLAEVPERYRSRIVVAKALMLHPEDIAEFGHLLEDDDDVSRIVSHLAARGGSAAEQIRKLPEKWLRNEAVLNAAVHSVKQHYNQHHKVQTLSAFPLEMLNAKDPELLKLVLRYGKVRWKDIPHDMRTPDVVADLPPSALSDVPVDHLPPDVVAQIANKSVDSLDVLPPHALTPDAARAALAAVNHYSRTRLASVLMKRMPKPIPVEILTLLASEGVVPFAEMPREAMTPKNIAARLLMDGNDALKALPRSVLTPEAALKVVEAKPTAVSELPKSLLTADLFTAWVDHVAKAKRGYSSSRDDSYKAAFAVFPKSSYTSEPLAELIKLRLMDVSDAQKLSPDLIDSKVVGAILSVDPSKTSLFSAKLDDKALASAIVDNWKVMLEVPTERWNPVLAYVAIKHWAASIPSYRYQRDDENGLEAQLRRIPRGLWNEKTWAAAVGYLAPLAECPHDILNDFIIMRAVERKPSEIEAVEDPADFLNRVADKLARDDKDFTMLLERKGVIKGRKGWINARDLPHRVKLPHGGSVVPLKTGPVNVRVYIFDNQDRVVMNLYTAKNEIKLPPSQTESGRAGMAAVKAAKKAFVPILEAARAMLGAFKAGDLTMIGIHGDGHGTFYEDHELPRGNTRHDEGSALKWTTRDVKGGTLHIAWLEDQPILRVVNGSTGRGWSASNRINDFEVMDLKACIEYGMSIYHHLRRYHDVSGHQLAQLGIIDAKSGHFTVAETKIAESGEFSIWKGGSSYPRWGDRVPGNRIALFGPNGLMAHAVIKANNKIGRIAVMGYPTDDEKDKLTDMFTKLANAALAKRAQAAIGNG